MIGAHTRLERRLSTGRVFSLLARLKDLRGRPESIWVAIVSDEARSP